MPRLLLLPVRQVLLIATLLLCSSAALVTGFTARANNQNKLETAPRRGGASPKRRRIARFSSSAGVVEHQQQQQQELNLPQRQQQQRRGVLDTTTTTTTTTTSSNIVSTAAADLISKTSAERPLLSKTALISIFGIWNGVADVICHKRHGCYANLMTGNLMQICTSLADGQWKHALQLATLIFSFMTGVALRQMYSTKSKHVIPWLAVPLLCGSELIYRLSSTTSSSTLQQHVAVMMLAMAGGIINSFASKATDNTVVFAVTGHFTRVANGIGSNDSIPKASLCVIGCFGLGITLTSAMYSRIAGLPLFAMLSIPYGLALMGMMMTQRRSSTPELMSSVAVQMTTSKRQ